MEVQKKQLPTPPPPFKKYQVTITVQSESEHNALLSLLARHTVVPKYLQTVGWIRTSEEEAISVVMSALLDAITS